MLSPEDSFSLRNPVIEEVTLPETEAHEVENEVAASVVDEDKALSWIKKSENKDQQVDELDENSSRFKLLNGKEVS